MRRIQKRHHWKKRSLRLNIRGAIPARFLTLAIAIALGMFMGTDCRSPSQDITRPDPVAVRASASAWSFGVIADTQWSSPDDGRNPHSVSVGIIHQVNAEFIRRNVKFVVAVGDITHDGSKKALDTRATCVQALYNAGIGFYPLRGNHESEPSAAAEFTRIFPQTQNGENNRTPSDAFADTEDDDTIQPAVETGTVFTVGNNFSSPSVSLLGLSYSFDYRNARFVLLDQFTPANGSSNSIQAQQAWIHTTLSLRPPGSHGFVFGHKGFINESHPDTLFGDDPADAAAAQDIFIKSLAANGIRYYVHGHDHMHIRSITTTTDATAASLMEIYCAACSSAFFTPRFPSDPRFDNLERYETNRKATVSQEFNTVGYYIYTVDGSRVTVDYYSAPVDSIEAVGPYGTSEHRLTTTPILTFTKRETWGYSLNGAEFTVPPGASYGIVTDSFKGTTVRILEGTNGRAGESGSQRYTKVLNTGWLDAPDGLYSPVFTLWGMGSASDSHPLDPYVLSISYDPSVVGSAALQNGWLVLATPVNGVWANAVNRNVGGLKQAVRGPWNPAYGLGTYGYDALTNNAWAVLNYNGDFALAPGD